MKIKNLRAGWVFIPDAGLKLKTGQVVEVEKLSPQAQMFIDKGYVAQVDSPVKAKKEASKQKSRTSNNKPQKPDYTAAVADYQGLSPDKAVAFIKKCTDPDLLRAVLPKENRNNVLDDLNARIKELGSF